LTFDEARAELGVPSKANPAAIRRAFKKLALQFHPDRNQGSAETTARFRRVLMAYEILTGQRTPSLSGSASGAAASPTTARQRPPRQHMPWDPPSVQAMPLEAFDGEPLHYPTPEEIAKLDIADPADPRKMMSRLAFGFLGLLALWWLLALLDPTPPPPPDPLRDKLHRDLGRPW
jgi:hypothetical protein